MATEETERAAARRRNLADGTIDFTAMYATHDAFERDLRRLTEAVAAGRAQAPGVVAGWDSFKHQLHIHHTAEDATLWPALRRKVTEPDEVEVIDAMEREHGRIDPLLAAVDAGFASGDQVGLAEAATEAAQALGGHMAHEEAAALPLIEARLTKAEWNEFPRYSRKINSLSRGLEFLPWMLDEAEPELYQSAMRILPAPARGIYRRVMLPRYRRRAYWR
ncbi:MAG TPA: hemerythrin domain-containing protein [Actinospica sp.]|nr:hemerythrin domain-containing protein [Actinospica sp.]